MAAKTKAKKARTKQSQTLQHHARRIIVVTPKFVHGMFVGALVGALVVAILRAAFPAYALSFGTATRDCSDNALIKCGVTSPREFIADVRADKPKDLQIIYNHFGLSSSDYKRFIREAVVGSDLRDGRIVVKGKTVATDAWSIGRQRIPGEKVYKIRVNNKTYTYYSGSNAVSYGQGVKKIPVFVLFDSKGVVQFVVMPPCGNAVGFTPKIPKQPKPPKPPQPPPPPTQPPPTTPPPKTPIVPVSVKRLPNTGAGAIIIIAILSVIGGYVFHMTHRHITHKRRARHTAHRA